MILRTCCLVGMGAAFRVVATSEARAQDSSVTASDAGAPLRVYLDCRSRYCDFDFFRTEITFVNWVRDRQVAEVHLLASTRATGAGGVEFTVTFIGRERFAGREDTLVYVSRQTDTDDAIRRGLSRTFMLGLVPFVSRTPAGDRLQISYAAADTSKQASARAVDPWNYWVFQARVNGNFNGQETSNFGNIFSSVSASRTTEAWKLRFSLQNSYNESSFDLGEGRTAANYQRSHGASGLIVKSLGSRWSAGGRAGISSSTFSNQELGLSLGPAVEYNFYPYDESTRRLLTARYSLGLSGQRYRDTTIFEKTRETLANQSLELNLSLKQKWGSVFTSLDGSHYLHDAAKWRAELFTSLDVRLLKGLSFNMFGSVSLVRDQLFLSKADISDEDVLLRRRQLATSYNYFVGFGLSYTFGSIYNNIVNPRFGSDGGGGNIIFF
ncbi:MAG: hypothetical protein ABR543_16340 [Gemmatimonadaceae bacterium]